MEIKVIKSLNSLTGIEHSQNKKKRLPFEKNMKLTS